MWTCVDWWRTWRDFKALPFPGDLLDQPAYVVEAIRLCADAAAEMEGIAQRKALEDLRSK